ncbi:hypothetical protein PYW08_016554 [Mythimna loreyi]|uniref:Uncharacterized protein n=1 Tax=Mythimna loreyi TaxID=667449 RepID=A0ACC2QXY6_9NEOP|nr:hypothetical protein PYW08_016554 [Mythimna loreyi]
MVNLQKAHTILKNFTSVKGVFFLVICVFMFLPLGSYLNDVSSQFRSENRKLMMNKWHATALERFFGTRMGWTFSNLGRILFNREEIPNPNPNANRSFVILVWKHWNWLKRRHVFSFKKTKGGENENDNILEGCSVKNCIFSGNDSLIDTADAVIIHLQKGLIPQVEKRNRKQRWIFLNDESPRNAFSLAKKKPTLDSLYNVFNWSMTYRSDADVPVPYGRVIGLEKPVYTEYKSLQDIAAIVPYWGRKNKRKVAAVLMSNCGVTARNEFLKKLRKYVNVDIYGGCADKKELKNSCPGHFKRDCDVVTEYVFYLVLENTSCFQYVTEKVFNHAYSKGAIPVIFGPTLEDVEGLLPPGSYLHADADTNIEMLAKNINTIAKNSELILAMHMWRNHFAITNQHGCPGHFRKDCDLVEEYIFYLVLENTSCFQYLTEKGFYHAYSKGAIPIIFGPTFEDADTLLPPNSYLYADEDTNIEYLAKDINAIAKSNELILALHMWRNHFEVVNEHGFFGVESYHWCRVCEALNYNNAKEKIYDKELLDSFLDPAKTCYDKKTIHY